MKSRPRPMSRRSKVSVTAAVLVAGVAGLAVIDLGLAGDRARSRLERQAGQAAAALDGEIAALEKGMTETAGAPGMAAAMTSIPGACNLSYKDLPVLGPGHIDIVDANGRVACTSQAGDGPARSHAGAPWLESARGGAGTSVTPGYRDPVTGTPVLAVVAPVRDGDRFVGAVAVFHPVEPVAARLAAVTGGGRTAFSVSDGQGLFGTSLGDRESLAVRAALEAGDWQLEARLPWSAVRSDARTAVARQTVVGLIAVLLMVAGAALIRRRIAGALDRLRREVKRAGRDVSAGAVEVEGPAEVAGLAAEVNEMLAARAEHHAHLAQRALTDVLTGLPNRAVLIDRLQHAHSRAERGQVTMAVLFLDLDNFKLINDTLGHDAGDQVLVAVAGRLLEAVRAGDTVVRFAGDEFVVICEGLVDADEALVVASRIDAAMAEPFSVAGAQISVGVSVGVAHGGPEVRPDDLLRDADLALYQAKARGRGRHAVYDESLRHQMATRLERQKDLAGALERGEIGVVYQPQYDLRTGTVVSVEALVRWAPPERGDIPRDWFLPIAEESGLIVPIGDFVLDRACRQAADWAAAGRQLRVSVNLSLRQLSRPGLSYVVARALADAGLEPERLCIEITERTLQQEGTTIDAVQGLARLGVRIAVDDYGTGSLSLPRLQQIPAPELKVDGAFLHAVGRSATASTLLEAMMAAALALGHSTAVEGLERPEQLEHAQALGCDLGQGHLLARPGPPEEIERWVDRPLLVVGPEPVRI